MLTQAKAVYTSLSQAVGEEEGALFNGKIQEITPSLRYCAYNIGDKQAAGELTRDQRMDLLVAQTKEEQASSLQEVEWRGRRMAVRQEKVRRFLLSHQESDSELERAEDAEARCQVYESLLLECKDALQALKEELVEDPEFRARQQVQLPLLLFFHFIIFMIAGWGRQGDCQSLPLHPPPVHQAHHHHGQELGTPRLHEGPVGGEGKDRGGQEDC